MRPLEDTDGSTLIGALFAMVLAFGGSGALVWFCVIRYKIGGGQYRRADYTEVISEDIYPLNTEEEMESMAMLSK